MAPNPSASASSSPSTSEAHAALSTHNKARAQHACPPLKWSENLEQEAQRWANHLAEIGRMVHSTGEERKGQGENLSYTWSSDKNFVPSLEMGVQEWLNEDVKYRGERIGQTNFQKWGHYTQCVWRNTTHVGIAKARDGKGGWFTVARYSPAGNIEGQKPY